MDKEHEILIAKGDLTLADLKRRYDFIKGLSEVKKEKSPLEEKKDSLGDFFASNTAADEAAREQKAANAAECKNDPKERKRRDRIVDFWRERELAGENDGEN